MNKNPGNDRTRSPQSYSNNVHYLLPSESAQVVSNKIVECRNMSLILGRYIPREAITGDEKEKNVKWKDVWLKERAKQFSSDDRLLQELIKKSHARWEAQTKHALQFSAKTQGRLIVGLGGKGVLETGLTLHHVTGLPVIPGSALKGLCRAYALYSLAAGMNYTEDLMDLDEALGKGHPDLTSGDAKNFKDAFGSTDDAGDCIFYDAVVKEAPPKPQNLFEVDVMTPHFPDYYQKSGEKAPSDDQSPVPISFMTVAATFGFAVGLRRGAETKNPDELIKWAVGHLQNGLYELGIGSKTAAGYGVFTGFEDIR